MRKLFIIFINFIFVSLNSLGIEIERLPWLGPYEVPLSEYVINFKNASCVEKTGLIVSYLNLQNGNELYSLGISEKFNNFIVSLGLSYLNIYGFFSDLRSQAISLGEAEFRIQGKSEIYRGVSLGMGANVIYSMFNFINSAQIIGDLSVKITTKLPSLYEGNNFILTSSLYNLGYSLDGVMSIPIYSTTFEYKFLQIKKVIFSFFSDLTLSNEVIKANLKSGVLANYTDIIKIGIYYNVGTREGEIGIFNYFSFDIGVQKVSLGYSLVFSSYVGNIFGVFSYLSF